MTNEPCPSTVKNMPTTVTRAVEANDRMVVGNLIKYVSDSGWTEGGLPVESNKKLAAVAVNKVLQRWQEERVVETIAQRPLPDPDEMNAAIPQSEWEEGPDGKPRPPWQLAHIVYLLEIETCEKLTFVSATIGAKIAVSALQDRVAWMRKLRGTDVVPQVELSLKPMSNALRHAQAAGLQDCWVARFESGCWRSIASATASFRQPS